MLNWMTRLFSGGAAKSAAHKARGDDALDRSAWDDAANSYRQALQDDPANAAACNNLALALSRAGRTEEARQAAQQAIVLDATAINPRYLLATLAQEAGDLDEACLQIQQAVHVAPDFGAGWSLLGHVARELGDAARSVAAYRKALALDPADASTHSNLLVALEAEGALTREELFAEHRRYAQAFEPPRTDTLSWPPAPARLKIGYVSADFRRHSVAHFVIPVLESRDRAGFEIYCYYNHDGGDDMTQRFVELADHFIACAALTDAQLAERIRADGIDVLVDLSGHTGGNRLPMFALKPAPVQVSWLGYIDTTGLAAMDYRLTGTDAELPGNDAYCSERLYRFPRLWWTFRPFANLPDVVPLPAGANGHIRFCSTNQIAKITPGMLAAWAAILHRVPRSTLTIMGVPSAGAEAFLAEGFAGHGIASERLAFHRFTTLEGFRATLAECDIALDTFPYNGGTTTCETLWTGMPCVTLAGQAFVSRMGLALLKEIGLPELAADSMESYVEVATALAQDLPGLRALRVGMRERLQASSLGDEAGFTRRLEAAWREMRAAVAAARE